MNSQDIGKEDHQPVTIMLNDKNEVTKADRQNLMRRRKVTCFEWIQLSAAICIPIIIGLYSIIDSNNSSSIAAKNRRKDLMIANISRISDREIALANRLNEIQIAEKNQQKDRDLAADQQYQNVLLEYQKFLANLILEYGTNLSRNTEARLAAQFMTIATLKQLDAKNKAIILRSLYHSKFITLEPKDDRYDSSFIDLRQADLSNTVFGLPDNLHRPILRNQIVPWYYLYLPYGILTNASFRGASLDCAQFDTAIMESADLSFIYHSYGACLDPPEEGQTSFAYASLARASFYKAHVRFTCFNKADLSFANMHQFYCIHCTFWSAVLYHANLTSSFIFNLYASHPGRLDFRQVNFSHAALHSSHYISINFDRSDWSNAQASQITIRNSTFTNAILNNCSFAKSFVFSSMFENATLRMVDLSNATLFNVTFINSDMKNVNLSSIKCEYCFFRNTTLRGAVFKNALFENSSFADCDVDMSQLEQAVHFSGSILSNGTITKNDVQ